MAVAIIVMICVSLLLLLFTLLLVYKFTNQAIGVVNAFNERLNLVERVVVAEVVRLNAQFAALDARHVAPPVADPPPAYTPVAMQ